MNGLLRRPVATLASLFLLFHCAGAAAGDGETTSSDASPGVAVKVERAIKRGASAAASGVERGAKATAKGVKRAASATEHAVGRVVTKTAPASSSPAKQDK